MFYAEVKEGHNIFSFHDFGSCFFIVDRGSLEMMSPDKDKRKVLRNNDGKIRLIQGSESLPCCITLREIVKLTH